MGVVAGMGGRVMVLDGANGKILAESEDCGMGGMALALADLTGDGFDEVIFAPLYSPIHHTGGTVRSHLHVLTTSPPISKAIFVATLNGELVVFQQTNGVVNPNPLFRTVVPGGIGAFNSIIVANLVPDTASKPEVYIAGSSGLRRFDFQ
jgi:hypothetical protein